MSVLTVMEDAMGIFNVPEIALISSLPLEGFFWGKGVLWVCGIPHCFSLCLCSQGQADEQDHCGKHHVCPVPSFNAFPCVDAAQWGFPFQLVLSSLGPSHALQLNALSRAAVSL